LGRSLFSEITKITLKIFFDLDGPILDVSKRYYRVFSDICGDKIDISRKDFWELKKEKADWKKIFKEAKPNFKVNGFRELWLKNIEMRKYLALDTLQPQAKKVLFSLSKKYPLFLLSLRQSKANLFWQVKKIGINKYFKKIIHCQHHKSPPWAVKAELIKRYLLAGEQALIVGDTEVDIRAAKLARIKSIAVNCGIRSEQLLLKEKPGVLISDIRSLVKFI